MLIESQKRYRLFLIVIVYLIVAIRGVGNGTYLGMSIDREYLFSVVIALALTYICIVDSKIVGKPLSIFSYWIVFIFCGIAVPVCIVRAHGIKGVGIIILHLMGLCLVLCLSSYVAWLLLYGSI